MYPTIEEAIALINEKHPHLIPGKDFQIGVPIDENGASIGPAFVHLWAGAALALEKPTTEQIAAWHAAKLAE